MNLGQEAIQEKKVTILCCPAKKMHEDGLSKTLKGADFKLFLQFHTFHGIRQMGEHYRLIRMGILP
jgi:hypothetical protein